MPNPNEFMDAVQEVIDMHDRKGADYGSQADQFANVSASSQWGIPPWVGAMMRANDKVVRLQSAARGSTGQSSGHRHLCLDCSVSIQTRSRTVTWTGWKMLRAVD